MPAQINLSINDGQATPVAHTWVAAGVVGGIATWLEKTSTAFAGYLRLTYAMKLPPVFDDTTPRRHTLKLVCPTLSTDIVTGAAKGRFSRLITGNLDVTVSALSTLQEKKDFVAYMANCMTAALTGGFGNQIVNDDPTT